MRKFPSVPFILLLVVAAMFAAVTEYRFQHPKPAETEAKIIMVPSPPAPVKLAWVDPAAAQPQKVTRYVF